MIFFKYMTNMYIYITHVTSNQKFCLYYTVQSNAFIMLVIYDYECRSPSQSQVTTSYKRNIFERELKQLIYTINNKIGFSWNANLHYFYFNEGQSIHLRMPTIIIKNVYAIIWRHLDITRPNYHLIVENRIESVNNNSSQRFKHDTKSSWIRKKQ